MKEVTEIITAEITIIKRNLDEEDVKVIEESRAEKEQLLAQTFKNFYDADDVKVHIQDFIHDKEDKKIDRN